MIRLHPIVPRLIALCLLCSTVGCGTTKTRTATQQLLISDAVDQAVANIDFRPLAGKRVYFDTQFIVEVKELGFVNSKYIISSLRQQMIAANLLLEESKDKAEYVVEARVGTVGSDGNEVVYGMPASNGITSAASLMPNAPPIPSIPEISIARKHTEQGAAKIAVFAYDRETRSPVWQSGITRSKSTSQNLWVFGAGPFQRGSIHEGIRFAGQAIRIPGIGHGSDQSDGMVAYSEEHLFDDESEEPRVADQDSSSISELLNNLPTASADEWLAPLTTGGGFERSDDTTAETLLRR